MNQLFYITLLIYPSCILAQGDGDKSNFRSIIGYNPYTTMQANIVWPNEFKPISDSIIKTAPLEISSIPDVKNTEYDISKRSINTTEITVSAFWLKGNKELSSKTGRTVLEDSRGYLWIGGFGGVTRYNGKVLNRYTIKEGLLNHNVTSIIEDNQGKIWIGSNGGICQFDGHEFKKYPLESKHHYIIGLFEDPDKNIWCYSGTEIFEWERKSAKFKSYNWNYFGRKSITCASVIGNEMILFGSSSGLFYFNSIKNIIEPFQTGSKLDSAQICQIFYDSKSNNYWILSFDELYKCRGKECKPAFGNKSNRLFAMSIDSDDIWLATKKYIYKSSLLKSDSFKLMANLRDTNSIVRALTIDRYGDLWIGHINGVDQLSTSRFHQINFTNEKYTNNYITDIKTDSIGNLWMGNSREKGLAVYSEKKGFQYINPQNSFAQCNTLLIDSIDSIILGGNDNIQFVEKDKITTYSKALEHYNGEVHAICKDSKDNFWIGSTTGIYKLNTKTNKFYDYSRNSIDHINDIEVDWDGNTWFASRTKGLIKYDTKKQVFSQIDLGYWPERRAIRQLEIDWNGNLWIGTHQFGIMVIERKNLNNPQVSLSLNTSNKLIGNMVFDLFVDSNSKNIWVTLGNGIQKFFLRNENFNIDNIIYETFKIEKGAPKVGIAKDRKGNIWFGAYGYTINYSNAKPNKYIRPPDIYISKINLFGSNTNWAKKTELKARGINFDEVNDWFDVPTKLELPYHQNSLSIEFSGMNEKRDARFQYEHRLLGHEKSWSKPTEKNNASFTNLRTIFFPKEFTFQLRTKSPFAYSIIGNQDTTESMASFSFMLSPPWWLTWWACLIYIGIITLFAYSMYLYRSKQVLSLEHAKNIHRENIRREYAENFHDELGAEITKIHFSTYKAKNASPEERFELLTNIESSAIALVKSFEQILKTIQRQEIELTNLLNDLRNQGFYIFDNSNIEFDAPKYFQHLNEAKMDSVVAHEVLKIFKEAMTNCLKHSKALFAKMNIEFQNQNLKITFKDNGIGFNESELTRINGVENMKNRARKINAQINIESSPQSGTEISLMYELPE